MQALRTFVLLLSLGFTSLSSADENIGEHWYALLIDEKRGPNATEYIGQLSDASYRKLIAGSDSASFFTLNNLFWIEGDGGVGAMSRARSGGRLYGYTDNAQYRYKSVVRVIKLDKETIEGHRELLNLAAIRR